MTKDNVKSVTVHYRRLVDREAKDLSISGVKLLNEALQSNVNGKVLKTTDSARVTTDHRDRRLLLLNEKTVSGYCYGEITLLRSGDVPVTRTSKKGRVALRTVKLGKADEAVSGSTYFLMKDHHLALVHQETGNSRSVQDYFNWLFRAPIGGLAQDSVVRLVPFALMPDGKPVGLTEVKSFRVKGEVRHASLRAVDGGAPQSRVKTRSVGLSAAAGRKILRALGLTSGSLNLLTDDELESVEFELLVRKREENRLQPLPDSLIQGLLNDGFDEAAEFGTEGSRRRGDGVAFSYPGDVETIGAYLSEKSVRVLMAQAFAAWTAQGLDI